MYIEAIERDDYKPLPGGIFNKGFVRSFARCVGFDEQEALAEYRKLEEQFKPADEELLRKYKPEVLTDDRAAQSSLPTVIFAVLIIALFSGGILYLVNYIQNSENVAPVSGPAQPANTVGNPQPPPSPPPAAPTMENARFEFRSETEPISLSATADGRTSIDVIPPGGSKTFEPRESLRLSYSKSLSSSARLFLNGKQIDLPSSPANPKRAAIEIEINANNVGKVWQLGRYEFDTNSATPAPTPSTPRPTPSAAATPVDTSVPTPSPTPSFSPRPGGSPAKTPPRTGTPANANRGGTTGTPPRPSPSPN